MKKIIIAIMLFSGLLVQAQTKNTIDSLIHEVHKLRQELHKSDSINRLFLDGIYNNIDKPRFKMYQTENIYNLLKLDTRTGQVWTVQYSVGDVDAVIDAINYGITSEYLGYDGKYELYPTKNKYNFIMIDTGTGSTYQVQWNTDRKYQFVIPLR